MSKVFAIVGRALIALIFIASGIGKLTDVAGTSQALASAGLSGSYAIPVGVFELVAGACLALGIMVRLVAILLAAFCALTILFFHHAFGDPIQAAMALKNIAIIGGLLLAFAHSQMWDHYYAIRSERRGEEAARDAERRLHEAELRAARAEALAETTHAETAHADPIVTDAGHDYRPEVRRRRWLDW